MDAVRKLNQKGFALIYIALMIVVLVALVSLAVDLGYVYVAKGQLQNAADAAALAGATQLPDVALVRSEAKKFAEKNQAAGEQVVIIDEDIQIGNFNSSRDPANPFQANLTPYNAVQITARRDVAGAAAENQGKIHTFFGGVFALISGGGTGWSEMGAAAAATAIRPPRPSAGILLCDNWCSPTPVAPGTSTTLYWDGQWATGKLNLEGKYVVAFSDYGETPPVPFSPSSAIMQLINGTLDSPVAAALCGKRVYTNNAATGNALNKLEDRLAKEIAVTPSYWEMIVPLVKSSDGSCLSPDVQGTSPQKADESYLVTRFAKVRMTQVEGHPHPNLTVTFEQCIECADVDQVAGIFHSQLVKNNENLGSTK